MSVRGYLTLVDDAVLVVMKKLDRVLDRQDVVMAVDIDLIDHRGQRRRLSGSRGPGHEYQASRLFTHVRHNGRQPKCVERFDLIRDRTKYRSNRTLLIEQIGTKARHTLKAERKIEFQILFESMFLSVGEHRIRESLRI